MSVDEIHVECNIRECCVLIAIATARFITARTDNTTDDIRGFLANSLRKH